MLDKKTFDELNKAILNDREIFMEFVQSDLFKTVRAGIISTSIANILITLKPRLTKEELHAIIDAVHNIACPDGSMYEANMESLRRFVGAKEEKKGGLEELLDSLVDIIRSAFEKEEEKETSATESEKMVEKEEKVEDDAAVKRFNAIMKEILDKNKNTKRLVGIPLMKDLIEVVEGYEGDLKVMNEIKEKMKEKTKEEKLEVVKDFVRLVAGKK